MGRELWQRKLFVLAGWNFKAHELYDTIWEISKRHITKQICFARTKAGERKKIIRTITIVLSTEKLKDQMNRTNAIDLST